MNQSRTLIFAGLCALGLVAGFAARRVSPDLSAAAVAEAGPDRKPAPAGIPREPAKPELPDIPLSRSADTVESLLAIRDGTLCARLALWLIDADEQNITAYWEAYKGAKQSDTVTDLVFINWTRLNPQEAIAATAGTPEANRAWWAWACHDPQVALDAAIAAGPEAVEAVARGIGEFHPAWLRRHFNELPEDAQKAALSGLGKWGDGEKPEAMIEFSREQGLDLDHASFTALIRKDPSAAWDWARENGKPSRYSDVMTQFIAQMAGQDPGELARLAALTPGGDARRKMDAAVFANLIKTDPDAALAQATSAEVPRVAAERLAAVGISMLKSDPDQAFDLALSLLEKCPDALMMMNTVRKPNGRGGGWGTSVPGVKALIDALFFDDPARLMDITVATGDRDPDDNDGFERYSDQWMERDLSAYAEWITQQTNPDFRNLGTQKVSSRLQQDGQYQDAVDWAMTLPMESRKRVSRLSSVIWNWARHDQAAAVEWLESADLPAAEKSKLQNRIPR